MVQMPRNGQPEAPPAPLHAWKGVQVLEHAIDTLDSLMVRVTAQDVTASNVLAATQCAAKIVDLCRVALDIKRLELLQTRANKGRQALEE
jgi:hypothetical protein